MAEHVTSELIYEVLKGIRDDVREIKRRVAEHDGQLEDLIDMHEDDAKIAALRQAIQLGDEQLDRGEGIPYHPDLLLQLTERARENSRLGRKVRGDVTP